MPGKWGSSTRMGARVMPQGVLVETAAEHGAELGPGEEGGGGGVSGDEAFAVVVDEGEEVDFLLGGEVDLADAEEEDGVEVVEVFGVEDGFAVAREDG